VYDPEFLKSEQEWDEIKKEIIGDYFEQLAAEQDQSEVEEQSDQSEVEVSFVVCNIWFLVSNDASDRRHDRGRLDKAKTHHLLGDHVFG
jgi:hypothetical protein